MRAIAVDDEPLALSVIDIFCNKTENIELVAKFTNGDDAIKYMDNNKDINLIFLDINMPNMSGVEIAKIIAKRAMIVFTTAYQDYAVEGFELEAVDYLMKPFSYERFLKAIYRVEDLIALHNNQASEIDSEAQFIMIKSSSSLIKLNISTIILIEGLKDYVKIVTTEKRYVTKNTMKNIEQSLGGFGFVRVQKSYVVNMNSVKSFEGETLTMNNGTQVPVGLQYKANFIELFTTHNLLDG